MRIYGKYYLIPFLYGIIFSWYGTFHVEGIRTLQELVLDMGCYAGDINSTSVGAIIEKNLPYILYVILFSTYIYRHFCNCGVYIFSRCEIRWRWYVRKAAKLFGFSVLYVIVLVLGRICPGILIRRFLFDSFGIYMLFHYMLTMTLWLFQMVLFVNLISIIWKSSIGSLIMVGAYMVSAISLFGIDCSHLSGWNLQRLLWNTSAYLVVSWHRIIFENKIFEGTLPYSLSFFRGYVYFGILCAAAFMAGLVLIEKIEVIGNYKG